MARFTLATTMLSGKLEGSWRVVPEDVNASAKNNMLGHNLKAQGCRQQSRARSCNGTKKLNPGFQFIGLLMAKRAPKDAHNPQEKDLSEMTCEKEVEGNRMQHYEQVARDMQMQSLEAACPPVSHVS